MAFGSGYTLATAYVDIVPNVKGIQGDLSKAFSGAQSAGVTAGNSAGDGFASSFGSKVKTVASVAAGVIAGFAGGAAIKTGLKRLTTIEDASTALNVQFGDTAKTAQFMDKILGVVSGTPFNLDQFANAGKNLVAFGAEADKVPAYLTAIGEAAAASGKGAASVDMMVDAFGSMQVQGKVSNDAINSLSAQGVPALAILANHFGVTTDAMFKMVSEGAVPAQEGIQALTDGIMNGSDGVNGSTVKFAGSMAALRTTFSGALGGMKASVARFGANLLKPWMADMTGGMTGLATIMDSGGKKLGALSLKARDAVVPAMTELWSGLAMNREQRAGLDGTESKFMRWGANIRDFAEMVVYRWKGIWGALFDGDSGGRLDGWDESFPILLWLHRIREFFQNTGGFIRTVVTRDFDPSQWSGKITEDSPIVDWALRIRDALQNTVAFVRTAITGDLNLSQWSLGTQEDNPIVDWAFKVREAIIGTVAFIRTAVSGDFDPSQWGQSSRVTEDSPIVGAALTIREKVGAAVAWIKGAWRETAAVVSGAYASMQQGNSDAFYQSLGGAAEKTKELVAGVRSALSALPSFSDILKVIGRVFTFLADHIDIVIDALPYLIAGFVAYKAIQLGVNVVQLASLPIQAGLVAAGFAQASANRALAVAMGGVYRGTIAQFFFNLKTMALWVAHTAVTIAQTAATVAMSIATGVATAATWALSTAVAFLTSPIGIVIAAIALLVAGVIYAWNNFDWFREAVLATWEWIQNAAVVFWEHFLKPILTGLWEALKWVGDAFVWLWQNAVKPALEGIWWVISNIGPWIVAAVKGVWEAIQFLGDVFVWLWQRVVVPVWNGIGTAISVAWNTIIRPLWDTLMSGIDAVGDAFSFLWNNVVTPVWNGIGTAIRWVWDNVIVGVFNLIKDGLGLVGGVFTSIGEGIGKAFRLMGDGIRWVWDNVILGAFNLIKDGLSSVGDFFGSVGRAIATAWDKITEWVAGPINWVIEHVWNNGIVALWNKITGWIPGVDISLGPLSPIVVQSVNKVGATGGGGGAMMKMSYGGVFPGYSPGVDNHYVPAGLFSGGEGVLIPEAVRGLGGPGFVHAANREFGGARSAAGNSGAADHRFFLGGIWEGIENIAGGIGDFVSGVAGNVADAASFTSGFITNPLSTIMGMLGSDVSSGLESLGGGAAFGKAIAQLPGDIVGGVISSVKGFLGLSDDGRGGTPPPPMVSERNGSQDPSSFGWSVGADLVPFAFGGQSFGQVAAGAAEAFRGLLTELVPQIPGGLIPGTNWGYENRDNVNSPGRKSFHAYGLALDVNSGANSNGAPGYGRSGRGVIPSGPAHSLAAKYGMEWGGDFTGTPDPMHFEVHFQKPGTGMAPLTAQSVAAGALSALQFGGGGGETRLMNTNTPDQWANRGTAAMVGPIPPGGAVERWRPLYLKALAMTGQDPSNVGAMLHQMDTESSGNPLAINLTDRNAVAGYPSKSLLQVIGPTFRDNGAPGYNTNIWDPLSNALASIRYGLARYGSLSRAYRGVAYDQGGWLMPNGGTGINLLNKPEAVLTPDQSAAYIAHATALAERGNGIDQPMVIQASLIVDGEHVGPVIDARIDSVIYAGADGLATALGQA